MDTLEIQQEIEKGGDIVSTENNNGHSIGTIIDELEGKTYGQAWDILKLYSDEVVRNIAENCPHPDAKEAARALLDSNNTDETKPVKKRIKTALIAICAVILIVLAAFFTPTLISYFSSPNADVFGSNEATDRITIHNILEITGSKDGLSHTARFNSVPFEIPDGTPVELARHIRNSGIFHVRLFNANYLEELKETRAIESWYNFYDADRILEPLGDPIIWENRWCKDLGGNIIRYDSFTAVLVISPEDSHGVAFDKDGVFTVVEIYETSTDEEPEESKAAATSIVIHEILEVHGTKNGTTYTAFFKSAPFDIPSETPSSLAALIRSGGTFRAYMLNANYPADRPETEPIENWYTVYDREEVLKQFGDPAVLENMWVRDLGGNNLTARYPTAVLVVSPSDKHGIAFDSTGKFTVVELFEIN